MIVMSDEATTLMGREEREGSAYPLWIERLLLLGGVVVFALFRSDVLASVDHTIGGVVVTYIVFPMALLAGIELLGRMLQRSMGS
ncbi:MAG: hypothetical protein CMB00_02065 [Euryarchaeota archaeon]|jgi:hypothetical protein|nr:hypothetical protein [Euryarchaeota archaeon]DAC22703.1 MAG TPA: hypothetical protein D7H91_02105 [Candidatus Poseidoniales archaeon]|tara:strand:+ start:783 stop:1037 length:255 start_codon:yes stop_codon:yes gene_type:complete